MKKLIALIICFVSINCIGQNIIQITNNGSQSTNTDCGFKINGICSSEDIGGVSLESISRQDLGGGPFSNGITRAYLKNYNNFTVTVLIQLAFDSYSQGGSTYVEEVYQVVIPSNETKTVQLNHCNCPGCYSLQGMIVRRLMN
ncbi:MAG: hypothetical protein II829_02510 [Bacteroidales bacterium]|nr:hypothetical protein [Bacteroidales bacterium]